MKIISCIFKNVFFKYYINILYEYMHEMCVLRNIRVHFSSARKKLKKKKIFCRQYQTRKNI